MEILRRFGIVIHWALFIIGITFFVVGINKSISEIGEIKGRYPDDLDHIGRRVINGVELYISRERLLLLNIDDFTALEENRVSDMSHEALDILTLDTGSTLQLLARAYRNESLFYPWVLGVASMILGLAVRFIFTGSKSVLPWSKP